MQSSNLKTTISGIVAIVAAIIAAIRPQYAAQVSTIISVAVGAGLINAQDAQNSKGDTK